MAKGPTVTRKGDLIELNGGAFRLERVAAFAAETDEGDATYKLYRKVDTNGFSPDEHGDDQETTYVYRYDPVAEFTAADDDDAVVAAGDHMKREG